VIDERPRLPSSASELIDWLNENYPDTGIRRGETLEDAHRRAGARELVNQLIAWRHYEVTGEGSDG
jgi:hypothetical protein